MYNLRHPRPFLQSSLLTGTLLMTSPGRPPAVSRGAKYCYQHDSVCLSVYVSGPIFQKNMSTFY